MLPKIEKVMIAIVRRVQNASFTKQILRSLSWEGTASNFLARRPDESTKRLEGDLSAKLHLSRRIGTGDLAKASADSGAWI
jgi:hypothetical protein